jgi:hypothetical protein
MFFDLLIGVVVGDYVPNFFLGDWIWICAGVWFWILFGRLDLAGIWVGDWIWPHFYESVLMMVVYDLWEDGGSFFFVTRVKEMFFLMCHW